MNDEKLLHQLIELRRLLRHMGVEPDGMELQVPGTTYPYMMLGFRIMPPRCAQHRGCLK